MFNDETILKILVDKYPTFPISIWPNFNQERSFQKVFRLFLENPNSAYYSEIKEHGDSYSLLDDKPFLNTVIKDNIQQSIHNGILMVFTDYVTSHLQSANEKGSIYNREHYHPKAKEVEGFELPVYYHIRFIGLMYLSAIESRIDISAISHRYRNMQTIYSGMVGQMINNIIITEENANKEYPTNYHWLIREIFNTQSHWLTSFGDEGYEEERYFDQNSSYVSFIPFSLSLCLSELYRGLNLGKITTDFLNKRIYSDILLHYFSCMYNDLLRTEIENEIIAKFPKDQFEEILTYSLKGKFAISFSNLISGNYGRNLKECEKRILERLSIFIKQIHS